ncbi:hypothetical protein KEJ39_08795, partial [Candidatus Bathyarchaeota archaeon]|nr:hypothetical protein [Candidatus Bathyarchaeota archaeon]
RARILGLNSEGFTQTLKDLFGSAAKAIERLIAENFYRRLDIRFQEREKWTLVDYVEDAKRTVMSGQG